MASHNMSFHKLNLATRLFVYAYIMLAAWWVLLNVGGEFETLNNYLYGAAIGVLPVLGGLVGLKRSRDWGGRKSAMGRATMLLGLGLITWGIGTLIFAYYNIYSNIEVPYPSLADVAYIISWPLWVLGVIQMAQATGAMFSLKRVGGRLQLVLIPLLISAFSYYLLIVVARGGALDLTQDFWKVFFDLAYPIGDIVILTAASLVFGLSWKYLGGRYKVPVLVVLSGFVLNYAADFSFSLTTTLGTFQVSNWVDFLFTSTMAVLAIGVSMLDSETGHEA